MHIAATLTRQEPQLDGARAAQATPSQRLLGLLLLSAAVALVVGAGAWGLSVPRDDSHDVAPLPVATVELADGTVRIDGLVDKQVGHLMPGMASTNDAPAGMRRFSVNVTLAARSGAAFAYSAADFAVSGEGTAAAGPVDAQLGDGSLPAGRALTGTLTFDVPEKATRLLLQFRQTRPVALPALPPAQGATGHGSGHDATQRDAPARAPGAPTENGHHHPAAATGQQ